MIVLAYTCNMAQNCDVPQTLYSRLGNGDRKNPQHSLDCHLLISRPAQCPVPEKKTIFWVATVLDTTCQRATAIPQSLILHKTRQYFVDNCDEHTNEQLYSFACCMHRQ